ncbi:unknown similar to AMEV145 [Choristoneura rosaceana entomopoxvirus 'L']|uniref:Uncharacterized protein n=1 Tax=Choristoneura rosaceana entomopoxvirus 'L' TaxID=1293539 RepID=A0ABM9QKL5_9POXV|nr:unknown similar to AMEV145 [Choristoneura rosaceana entomopoxvirus 'L']CCU56065.1 unknown similar to AMEV145 [Choristoneura rosaceana entomopoxvirus 'L']
MKSNIINLIDILKTKTYIINKYENKDNNIYFNGYSYNKVSHTIDEKNDIIILTTEINNTNVIYYIYKNIKNNFNINESNVYPHPIIMLDNTTAQYKKTINVFNNELLSIHYPTNLKQDNISIGLVTDDVGIEYLKPSADSSLIEYKILYHPIYMKDLKIISYERNDMCILKSYDYRRCKPIV